MDIRDIRRENLARLASQYETQMAFCYTINKAQPAVSALLKGARPLGDRLARDIERTLDIPVGWLDTSISISSDSDETTDKASPAEVHPPVLTQLLYTLERSLNEAPPQLYELIEVLAINYNKNRLSEASIRHLLGFIRSTL